MNSSKGFEVTWDRMALFYLILQKKDLHVQLKRLQKDIEEIDRKIKEVEKIRQESRKKLTK